LFVGLVGVGVGVGGGVGAGEMIAEWCLWLFVGSAERAVGAGVCWRGIVRVD
jgi:hypothetical protein